MSTRYLTPEEAAEYLRVSPRTLANLRWSGRGGPRYRRHGGKPVYSLVDLDAWSDAQARFNSSERLPEAANSTT